LRQENDQQLPFVVAMPPSPETRSPSVSQIFIDMCDDETDGWDGGLYNLSVILFQLPAIDVQLFQTS
jgi:hypothetical protein